MGAVAEDIGVVVGIVGEDGVEDLLGAADFELVDKVEDAHVDIVARICGI